MWQKNKSTRNTKAWAAINNNEKLDDISAQLKEPRATQISKGRNVNYQINNNNNNNNNHRCNDKEYQCGNILKSACPSCFNKLCTSRALSSVLPDALTKITIIMIKSNTYSIMQFFNYHRTVASADGWCLENQLHRVVVSTVGCCATEFCKIFVSTSILPRMVQYHKIKFQWWEEVKILQQHEQMRFTQCNCTCYKHFYLCFLSSHQRTGVSKQ